MAGGPLAGRGPGAPRPGLTRQHLPRPGSLTVTAPWPQDSAGRPQPCPPGPPECPAGSAVQATSWTCSGAATAGRRGPRRPGSSLRRLPARWGCHQEAIPRHGMTSPPGWRWKMTGKNGSKRNVHQEAPWSPPRFTCGNKAPPIPSQGLGAASTKLVGPLSRKHFPVLSPAVPPAGVIGPSGGSPDCTHPAESIAAPAALIGAQCRLKIFQLGRLC